ncbi:hypothetical protein NEDG_01717 [Nematocida displodere]|uniref:Uncharacterized protein n=1 Tax=Nematocida displodere TaxID=1805483 RepID=A0A177EDU2_9MICR|nr:hypothetical protein NEDG_01717 [Nematocida displodere]
MLDVVTNEVINGIVRKKTQLAVSEFVDEINLLGKTTILHSEQIISTIKEQYPDQPMTHLAIDKVASTLAEIRAKTLNSHQPNVPLATAQLIIQRLEQEISTLATELDLLAQAPNRNIQALTDPLIIDYWTKYQHILSWFASMKIVSLKMETHQTSPYINNINTICTTFPLYPDLIQSPLATKLQLLDTYPEKLGNINTRNIHAEILRFNEPIQIRQYNVHIATIPGPSSLFYRTLVYSILYIIVVSYPMSMAIAHLNTIANFSELNIDMIADFGFKYTVHTGLALLAYCGRGWLYWHHYCVFTKLTMQFKLLWFPDVAPLFWLGTVLGVYFGTSSFTRLLCSGLSVLPLKRFLAVHSFLVIISACSYLSDIIRAYRLQTQGSLFATIKQNIIPFLMMVFLICAVIITAVLNAQYVYILYTNPRYYAYMSREISSII